MSESTWRGMPGQRDTSQETTITVQAQRMRAGASLLPVGKKATQDREVISSTILLFYFFYQRSGVINLSPWNIIWANRVKHSLCSRHLTGLHVNRVPAILSPCSWSPVYTSVGYLHISAPTRSPMTSENQWCFFILQIGSARYACQDYITKHSINTNMNTERSFLN